jgi:hypothetical protein
MSKNDKSPSQRLRNTLFIWHEQMIFNGKKLPPFEEWYPIVMEKIINQVKNKLEKNDY